MNISIKKSYEIFCTIIFAIGFIFQFLVIQERVGIDGMTWFQSIAKTLSYMTIWTNIILFVTFILLTFNKINHFKPSYFSALLTYIAIVGVVYHVALAHLWTPTGYLLVTDRIFHTYGPLLYLIYWLFFTKKTPLDYTLSLKWVWYPTVYTIFFMILGLTTHNYPYPIFNLDTLPFLTVFRNLFMNLMTYIVFGAIIIATNNFISKRKGEVVA
ncbi:MAG TPA: Pr6Pr family membrane protein [Chitinophagales bacterium]|nr:Pr6Pr family membrane protein [Chitinophagales bacterium]